MGKGILNGVIPAPGAALPATVDQSEAEAGTATTDRIWTAERVKQAIAALESGGAAFKGALVFEVGGGQTLTDNVAANVLFDSEVYDTDAFHNASSNTDRLTIPSGVSKVRLSGNVRFNGAINLLNITAKINHFNSSDVYQASPGSPDMDLDFITGITRGIILNITSGVISVAPGDYFKFQVFQNSDGNIAINSAKEDTWFSIEVVE